MIPIKVQCDCGQRYAFDVEPVDGQMPYTVACPVCGADGTSAANEVIAQTMPAEGTLAAAAVAAPAIRLQRASAATVPTLQVAAAPAAYAAVAAAPAPSQPAARLLPGQVSRSQAEMEARAKIFWGNEPEEVIKFLMRNNCSHQEASELVGEMFDERAKAIRSGGFGKIFTGSGMVSVPVIAWFIFSSIGVIPLKLFAITVMVGLWGAWRILKGTIMVVSPRSEKGDVSDQ